MRMILVLLLILCCTSIADARGRRWSRTNTYPTFASSSVSFSGDPQQVADQKARYMAARCLMRHLGGGYGGANAEGVGAGMSAVQALANCCFTGRRRVAGQACYQGSNGMWYACKLYW